MDTSPVPSQKKGLGVLGWLGIGCGGLIVLGLIGFAVFYFMYGSKIKQFAQDAAKDPTKATATTMVNMTGGQFEFVAQDEANKRYTLRQKATGQLTTIYWDAKRQAPVTIPGDFSAIPADANPPAVPEPAPK